MSRTKRRNWYGKQIRDGEHAKRCPEPDCDYCINGESKYWFKRKFRREQKKELRNGKE